MYAHNRACVPSIDIKLRGGCDWHNIRWFDLKLPKIKNPANFSVGINRIQQNGYLFNKLY